PRRRRRRSRPPVAASPRAPTSGRPRSRPAPPAAWPPFHDRIARGCPNPPTGPGPPEQGLTSADPAYGKTCFFASHFHPPLTDRGNPVARRPANPWFCIAEDAVRINAQGGLRKEGSV